MLTQWIESQLAATVTKLTGVVMTQAEQDAIVGVALKIIEAEGLKLAAKKSPALAAEIAKYLPALLPIPG